MWLGRASFADGWGGGAGLATFLVMCLQRMHRTLGRGLDAALGHEMGPFIVQHMVRQPHGSLKGTWTTEMREQTRLMAYMFNKYIIKYNNMNI